MMLLNQFHIPRIPYIDIAYLLSFVNFVTFLIHTQLDGSFQLMNVFQEAEQEET